MRTKIFRRLWVIGVLLIVVLAAVGAASAVSVTISGTIASGAQFDLYTVDFVAGEDVIATLVCDFDGVSRPLDPVLSVFFPGGNPSNTIFADVYNDDGFGLDDDPNGVDCDAFDSSRVIFTAPVTGTYTFRADGFGSSTGPYILSIFSEFRGNPLARDGRINPHAHAPIVAYCNGESTDFYSVTGQLQGSVANGGTATFGAAIIRPTADGRMEISAGMPDGKTYLFIYDGCPGGSSETYTVVDGVPTLYLRERYGR